MKTMCIVGLAAFALAPRAYADSCDDRIESVMTHYPTYVTYCAECGDAAPSAPVATVPGQVIAAHAYVQTSPARFDQVAALAGCALDGSEPASLRVIDETPTGMLIVPDDVPPPAPAAAPPAPPALVTVDAAPMPWLVGLIGGLGGSLVTLAWLAPRRRRASLPRALDLPRGTIDR